MRNTLVKLCCLALLASSGCGVHREEVPGTYVVRHLHNTLDTLRLLPQGTYERTLRATGTGHVLFQNRSAWTYADGRLILFGYLLDEDEEVSPERVYGLGTTMTCDLPIETRLNNLVIYYRQDENNSFYYEKL